MADRDLTAARESLGRGQAADAERLLQAALRSDPGNAEALHLLGLITYRRGDAATAREHLEAAVASRADSAEIHAHLAEVLRHLGEHEAAVAAGHEAVRLEPEAAPAHNNLGLALEAAGELEQAEDAFRRGCDVDPGYPRSRYNLGNLLRQRSQPEQAEVELRRALELKSEYPQALNALGVVLDELGRGEEAVECFHRAIRLAPGYAKPLLNYGNLLARLKRFDQALGCYDQALRLNRDYYEAWLAKATLFQQQERYDQALDAVRHAGRLRPDDAEVPFRCGQVHFARFAYLEAISWLERALSKDPDHRGAVCALAQARGEACEWEHREEEMEAVRHALDEAREAEEPAPMPPFVSFLPFEPAELLALAREAAERLSREAAHDHETLGSPVAVSDKAAPRLLRLGYLSSDFRNHAVAQMTRRVYRLHERDPSHGFEVRAYSLGPDDGSDYRRGIASDCDAFVDLRQATDTAAARRIRADGVDLLIDLAGFTHGGRPGIVARRPAPIQVSWLYPASMGGVFHDYLIGDPVTTPTEHADRYGEKLALLPHCYHATDDRQKIDERKPERSGEGLPEEGFVFCCFNKLAKIDPETFSVWMRILEQVPRSVLWIPDGPGLDNLRREAGVRGVSGDRLRPRRFAATKSEHLARHRLADLFLDTRIFAAHTTAADALWSGVPLLTCPGETFASRVAASMLEAIGLQELVMPDLATYERRAVELASSPALLDELRDKLVAQRDEWPLFDTPRFVRNLERAYRTMWRRYEEGEAPDMLIINE